MDLDKNQGVFPMAVACKLTGLHDQTLRKYERAGFLKPERINSNRLFSHNEIETLQHIKELEEKYGFNIAGIRLALAVEKKGLKIEKLMA